MTSSDQSSSTALVTGASRGFGRAIASARHPHRDGMSVEEYLERFGPTLKVDDVGKAAVDLVVSPECTPGAYLLTAAGLSRLT